VTGAVEVGQDEPPHAFDDGLRPSPGVPAEHRLARPEQEGDALARRIDDTVAVEVPLEGYPGGLGREDGRDPGELRVIARLAQLLHHALEGDPGRLLRLDARGAPGVDVEGRSQDREHARHHEADDGAHHEELGERVTTGRAPRAHAPSLGEGARPVNVQSSWRAPAGTRIHRATVVDHS
jgi:hypothetical protein